MKKTNEKEFNIIFGALNRQIGATVARFDIKIKNKPFLQSYSICLGNSGEFKLCRRGGTVSDSWRKANEPELLKELCRRVVLLHEERKIKPRVNID
jgi:hypothetical protein